MQFCYCSGLLLQGRRQGLLCEKLLFKYEPPCEVEIKCPRCHALNLVQVPLVW